MGLTLVFRTAKPLRGGIRHLNHDSPISECKKTPQIPSAGRSRTQLLIHLIHSHHLNLPPHNHSNYPYLSITSQSEILFYLGEEQAREEVLAFLFDWNSLMTTSLVGGPLTDRVPLSLPAVQMMA